MKKIFYAALLGTVLLARPVSGLESDVLASSAAAARVESAAAELIPEKLREVLDRMRPAASEPAQQATASHEIPIQPMQLAAISPAGLSAPSPQHASGEAPQQAAPSEPANWTLLTAILLIGFIIRRRTAVR
jgi:hypothetical protein